MQHGVPNHDGLVILLMIEAPLSHSPTKHDSMNTLIYIDLMCEGFDSFLEKTILKNRDIGSHLFTILTLF